MDSFKVGVSMLEERSSEREAIAAKFDYSRYYLRFHNLTDSHFVQHGDAEVRPILKVAPRSVDAALDIGCGMGFVMGGLRRAGVSRVIGIDSSLEQITAAKSRGLDAKLVSAEQTCAWLDGYGGRFDLITCIDVMEHIPPDALIPVLRAAERLLNVGGVFYCRVPNALSPIAGRQLFNDWTHYKAFTDHSLDFVLFNGGFGDIRVIPTDDPPFRLGGLAGWAARRITRGWARLELAAEIGWTAASKLPLTANVVGIASK